MKKRGNIIWLLLLAFGTLWILSKQGKKAEYQQIHGVIFGTFYNITYQYHGDIKNEVEQELHRFDLSLSPFKENSIISKVNHNEKVELDTLFVNVFNRAQEISQLTQGAFDITVAPLVNAWGFGFKTQEFPDSVTIDSLLTLTGYEKIHLFNNKIHKEDPRIMLDCSAIAKGYAVDVIANLLNKKGVDNYMVEIGGEIRTKGLSAKSKAWKIGVNKPTDDSLALSQELEMVLQLSDVSLATSGNYRNFYYKEGKKYAHTIDPRTGYPVEHNLLSATVIAPNCMSADAFATSFMVMGVEKSMEFAQKHPDLALSLIYIDTDGEMKVINSDTMKKYIVQED